MKGPGYAADPNARFDSYSDFYRNSAYRTFPQQHASLGSMGATMIAVEQEPIDLIDASVPEYLVAGPMYRSGWRPLDQRNDPVPVRVDYGDGMKPFDYRSGREIHVVPPSTGGRYVVDRAHSLHVIGLPKRTVDDIVFEPSGSKADLGRFLCRLDHNPVANLLVEAMWAAKARDSPANGLWFDGLTLQLLSVLADDRRLSPALPIAPSDRRIRRAVDHVEAHLDGPLDAGHLAATAGLSRTYFMRVFKATTGTPVWSYVQRRRVERAVDMLRTSDLPIAHVALACGFANQTQHDQAVPCRTRHDARCGAQ